MVRATGALAIGKHFNRFLVYDKDGILSALKLTDAQLAVLACVIKNDYESNIRSLAWQSNHKIIKTLEPRHALARISSVQVFSHLTQTVSPDGPAQEEDWGRLHQRFEDLKILHQQKKKDGRGARSAEQSENDKDVTLAGWTPRHKRHQQYSRYLTIDLPPQDDQTHARHHHRPRYNVKQRGQPMERQNQPKAIKKYTLNR
ncbi:hypothetical protein DFQ27_009410 [Actinomortierella ambigua]|uniref:Uncharacterized protein n=1 Tax=Actinomortierella ambigua TaxID=1343610 RepID=A0A9P6PP43_9FUNG|nr:hypothetical protein DFQ27_009410 [Actinomortierella ambigua]